MNDKFDELTKIMAQSVTRRAALKQFGVGLAVLGLASLGLANEAQPVGEPCDCSQPPYWGCSPSQKGCIKKCGRLCKV